VDKARAVALTPQLVASAKDVAGAKGPEYLSSEIVEGGRTRRRLLLVRLPQPTSW